jgi:polysaccharide lyase-like protein
VRSPHRPRLLVFLLLLAIGPGVIATVLAGVSSAVRTSPSAPAAPRDLTLSFDARPAYAEWYTIQPGYKCVNGGVSLFAPSKPSSAAFVRDGSKGNVRHGRYSARVVVNPGDHASYTCKAEAVEAVQRLGEGEGSSSWWAWSWKLPVGWRGTNSWGELLGFRANHVLWPSYGMVSFDAASKNSIVLNLHTGLTPNPGSSEYNSAYEKSVTLLGRRSPRRMVYGKWLDFYMHVVWRSRSNGVLEIWYRQAGKREFTKLYSNVPGGKALIQVRPHPTLLYNSKNGAPAGNAQRGLVLQGGFYRANTNWTNTYWWDGMRRRRTRASVVGGFRPPT